MRVTPSKTTGLPVKGNKRKAEAMLNEWRVAEAADLIKRKADRELRRPVHLCNMLFTQFLLDWLAMMKNSIEITTFESYERSVKKRIVPYFDDRFPTLTISQITPKHIQDYYTWEMNEN